MAWLEDWDIFSYDAPLRATNSNFSGSLSLGVAAVMVWTLINALMSLSYTEYTYSTSVQASESEYKTALPDVYVVTKDIDGNYFYDEKYYQWEAQHITIYESSTNPLKPKEKVDIPMKKCDIKVDEDRQPIEAVCLDFSSFPEEEQKLYIEGRFENDIYKYLQLALVPCLELDIVNNNTANAQCAPRSDVLNKLTVQSVSFSLWINEYVTPFQKGWVSALYLNTAHFWQGVEMYFERRLAERKNVFGQVDKANNWMQSDGYALRGKPIEWENGTKEANGTTSSLVKMYLRARDTEQKESIVQYGFIDFIEQLGGMWSILTLIIGSLGLYVSANMSALPACMCVFFYVQSLSLAHHLLTSPHLPVSSYPS